MSTLIKGYTHVEINAMQRRYDAALRLQHESDLLRVLSACRRLTPHDGLAMTEALHNYEQATALAP